MTYLIKIVLTIKFAIHTCEKIIVWLVGIAFAVSTYFQSQNFENHWSMVAFHWSELIHRYLVIITLVLVVIVIVRSAWEQRTKFIDFYLASRMTYKALTSRKVS